MYDRAALSTASPAEFYAGLIPALQAGLEGDRDAIANLANASALLFDQMDNLNWCGFYLLRGGQLIVGPFQGKPACVRIPLGRGVCGTAALRRQTIVVPDVHAFPGHIACDGASQSEIVVPMIKAGRLLGVLDLDAPLKNRFTDHDARGLEAFVHALWEQTDIPPWLGE